MLSFKDAMKRIERENRRACRSMSSGDHKRLSREVHRLFKDLLPMTIKSTRKLQG